MSDRRDPDVHRLVMDWPDDAIAEIERLRSRLAEAEALLDEAAFYPLQFAAKEPTARSVYERIKAFRASDSALLGEGKP